MASKGEKKLLSKNKKIIYSVIGVFVALIVLVAVFGTPSADAVFKDMNEKMLMTKSVTIDQKLTMKGTADMNARLYMDFNSSKEILSKGNFTINITSVDSPMVIAGDLIKVGDSNYTRYSKISSTDSQIEASLSPSETKLKNNWIKVRANDQFYSFTNMPAGLTSNILPIPYANLTDIQRKDVLGILQDKSMYTISESSKVDVSGVAAYKYLLTYNKDQYKKAAKAIAGYVSYFKSDDTSTAEITSVTVWVNITTKQLIKMEYSGVNESSDISGSLVFSGYDEKQTVEKPSDYSIESELLN